MRAHVADLKDGTQKDVTLPLNWDFVVDGTLKVTLSINDNGEASVYFRGSPDEIRIVTNSAGALVYRKK